MRSLLTLKTTAEYDLVDPRTPTDLLRRFFVKPRASWEPDYLEPGELECVRKASIVNAETQTIEIDREESIVWVTYVATVDIEYDSHLLDYFGASMEDIVKAGCQITFPSDERVVEIAAKESALGAR